MLAVRIVLFYVELGHKETAVKKNKLPEFRWRKLFLGREPQNGPCLSLGFFHHSVWSSFLCKFRDVAEVINAGGGHDEGMSNVTKCSVTRKPAAASHTSKNPTSAATAVKLRIPTAASGIRTKTAANNCNRHKSQDSSKVAIVERHQNSTRQITNKSQEKILVRNLSLIFLGNFCSNQSMPVVHVKMDVRYIITRKLSRQGSVEVFLK